MIEDREKEGADPDNVVGIGGDDPGVEKGGVLKCCRRDANCGGPIINGGERAGADPDKAGISGDDPGVEKGVVVKRCRRDAKCGGPMIEGGERAGADPYKAGFVGANTDVDKGVGVKFCWKDTVLWIILNWFNARILPWLNAWA